MKAVAINGSPRKNWNTYKLLEQALKGAKTMGADVEMINLFDHSFKGCVSCFGCKRKGAEPCKCFFKDDLSPILERVQEADILFVGSPIYFGEVTGATRNFLERLAFPSMTYDDFTKQLYNGRLDIAFFYTMNAGANYQEVYRPMYENNVGMLRNFGGTVEYNTSIDTLQFDDYSKYQAGLFNEDEKIKRHNEQFPKDMQKAFEVGKRLASR